MKLYHCPKCARAYVTGAYDADCPHPISAPKPSHGFGLVVFPFSWHLGYWPRDKKTLFAIGPFRLVHYRASGPWAPKRPEVFENVGGTVL